MSCVAEENDTSSVRTDTAATVGRPVQSASAATEAASSTWPIPIQTRFRPRRGAKRSMSGDQRNLKVYGACASVISPIDLMTIPSCCIQNGTAVTTSPSGSPDEKERSETAESRQLWNAARSDFAVLSLSAKG